MDADLADAIAMMIAGALCAWALWACLGLAALPLAGLVLAAAVALEDAQ